VEVKDIRLPQQLTRAMAAEAEAAREARAKVVAAEGEQKVRAKTPAHSTYARVCRPHERSRKLPT
jgi:regulator of protease activity HflC (stomatin/prohibitin superfamily)